jgi:hypothetical protein
MCRSLGMLLIPCTRTAQCSLSANLVGGVMHSVKQFSHRYWPDSYWPERSMANGQATKRPDAIAKRLLSFPVQSIEFDRAA